MRAFVEPVKLFRAYKRFDTQSSNKVMRLSCQTAPLEVVQDAALSAVAM